MILQECSWGKALNSKASPNCLNQPQMSLSSVQDFILTLWPPT